MIGCAKRSLTALELQHLLAVEVGEAELDDQYISERLTIIPFCARLAIVDEESDIIKPNPLYNAGILREDADAVVP
jgi:hypothetical protein